MECWLPLYRHKTKEIFLKISSIHKHLLMTWWWINDDKRINSFWLNCSFKVYWPWHGLFFCSCKSNETTLVQFVCNILVVHLFLNLYFKTVSRLSCWHASSAQKTAGKSCKFSELLGTHRVSLSRLFKWPNRCSPLMFCCETPATAPPNRKCKVRAYLELTSQISSHPP